MAGRDRIAALKRARERQRRVEEQVTRTVRALTSADRARVNRERVIERADQRLADATSIAMHETAQLVSVCGSIDAVAQILDLDVREVRRAISTAGSTASTGSTA